jgi:hypothetical protein
LFVRDQDFAHNAEATRFSEHYQTRTVGMLDVNDQRELPESSAGTAARTAGEPVAHVGVEHERVAGRQHAKPLTRVTAVRMRG